MNIISEIENFLGVKKTDMHDEIYCVLTGQFSSGKSKFMNKLIDKIYVTKDKKLEIHYRIKKSEVLV